MKNPTLDILTAVDAIVTEARKQHEDIPEKLVVVMDSGKRRSSMVHGHFARLSWHDDYSEIKLGTESLARGAVPTLGTVLHELSHAVAFARGVQDTSNKGRYHNSKFREIANEMGIHVEQDGTIGWSKTSVPEETQQKYSFLIEDLDKAITTYREGYKEVAGTAGVKRTRAVTKMRCECPDSELSINIKWWDNFGRFGTCGVCLANYELVD